jgi:hypothetical protein
MKPCAMLVMALALLCYFLVSRRVFDNFVLPFYAPHFPAVVVEEEPALVEVLSGADADNAPGKVSEGEASGDGAELSGEYAGRVASGTGVHDAGAPALGIDPLARDAPHPGRRSDGRSGDDGAGGIIDDLQKESFLHGEYYNFDAATMPLEAASAPRYNIPKPGLRRRP